MYAWISVIIANFHHKYNRHHIQIISKELSIFLENLNSEKSKMSGSYFIDQWDVHEESGQFNSSKLRIENGPADDAFNT